MSLSCFKQLAPNFTRILALSKKFILGLRLLLDVYGGLMYSSDNPFGFHDEIVLLIPIF